VRQGFLCRQNLFSRLGFKWLLFFAAVFFLSNAMFALIFAFFAHFLALNAPLRVSLTNIREAKGSVYVAVYDRRESFLDAKKMCARQILPTSKAGDLSFVFADLPPGYYALSCFHDVNGNGKLDTNLAGIPTEPYGFSNNARPKFRAPTWAESVFELKNSGSQISIKLEKW
jgi:uncharacterized protein (DUF2141 family)